MNIIKLSAIDSTNAFLKSLVFDQYVENFTVVIAESQLNGKGQTGSIWNSESGKNLTFSVLVRDVLRTGADVFKLNILVSISIIKALEKFKIKKLNIKWPNDILSEQKKIAGILIENVFKGNNEIISIIGIGLNVNQVFFENLPQASSLSLLNNKEFDKDEILFEIIAQLKWHIAQINSVSNTDFWAEYHNLLFKMGVPTVFIDSLDDKFMGIIKGVTSYGKLVVMLEDDSKKEFDIKELKMLY